MMFDASAAMNLVVLNLQDSMQPSPGKTLPEKILTLLTAHFYTFRREVGTSLRTTVNTRCLAPMLILSDRLVLQSLLFDSAYLFFFFPFSLSRQIFRVCKVVNR